MPKQLECLIIDLKIGFLLLWLFAKVFLFRHHHLFALTCLSHIYLIVIFFGIIDNIIWVIFTFHIKKSNFLFSSVSIYSLLQRIIIS